MSERGNSKSIVVEKREAAEEIGAVRGSLALLRMTA
jgi:hypothetical protein